jgi:hypothetical protein
VEPGPCLTSGAAPTYSTITHDPEDSMSTERKTYKAHPNGKRPPFVFDLEDDEGIVTTFTCRGSAQMLDLMAFAQAGSLDVTDPRGAKAIHDVFESTMGPVVFADFQSYCRTNDVDPEVTMQILMDMVEHTLSRPLARRLSSSVGQAITGDTSMHGSSATPQELSPEQIAQWQRTAVEDAANRAAELRSQQNPLSMTELAQGYPPPPAFFQRPQGGSQTP